MLDDTQKVLLPFDDPHWDRMTHCLQSLTEVAFVRAILARPLDNRLGMSNAYPIDLNLAVVVVLSAAAQPAVCAVQAYSI